MAFFHLFGYHMRGTTILITVTGEGAAIAYNALQSNSWLFYCAGFLCAWVFSHTVLVLTYARNPKSIVMWWLADKLKDFRMEQTEHANHNLIQNSSHDFLIQLIGHLLFLTLLSGQWRLAVLSWHVAAERRVLIHTCSNKKRSMQNNKRLINNNNNRIRQFIINDCT